MKPNTKNPIADKPIADKPIADKPIADKPIADKPIADKSINLYKECPCDIFAKITIPVYFRSDSEADRQEIVKTLSDTSSVEAIVKDFDDYLQTVSRLLNDFGLFGDYSFTADYPYIELVTSEVQKTAFEMYEDLKIPEKSK